MQKYPKLQPKFVGNIFICVRAHLFAHLTDFNYCYVVVVVVVVIQFHMSYLFAHGYIVSSIVTD